MAMAPLSIDQLNEQYGLDGRLRIVRGRAGLPLIEIDNHQARAQLSVYAGQLLSYTPQGESEDLLFLSGQAHYHPGKAIRGGVPVSSRQTVCSILLKPRWMTSKALTC